MAEDLPKLSPPRDEADRRLRALLGIAAGGETGAKFVDTLGYPSVAAAIRAGAAEANPDYVTTGEVTSPAVWPAILGNAATEIGTGIKNWWTGNDPDKPTLKPLETYLSERRQPRTSREAYVNAAAEKFMASPAYQDMIKRNMIKASGRELRLIRDQAGLEWDKTNTPDALAKETQDLTTEYDKVVRPGYDRDLERYYAQSFGERNPGLSSALPALGTLGAMLFTRGRFKSMADEANAITKEISEAAQRGDSVALARARQKAAKLPGKGEKIATGLAGLSIPVEAQLFQDIQDKHTVPPRYQDSSGTWQPSLAYERAARNLDPEQDLTKTLTLPLVSGVLGAATGYKLAPKMRPPPGPLSPDEIKLAADEIEAGVLANDRIARLKASLSGPGTSPSGTAIGTNPTAGSIGSPGVSPQIAAGAGHTAPGPLPALPQSTSNNPRASYKSLPPLIRDRLRAAYIGDRNMGPVKPGSMARKAENTLQALGLNVPVSRRRVKATNQAVEAFERAQGRLPQGSEWDTIFTNKTLAVPLATTLGLGALADREEYANGGPVAEPVTVGPLHSRVPGRTDHLAITVPEGAFVVPADVVAYLGEGNSTAGLDRASEMFPSPRALRANGGKVPIAAAGGEYVVSPEMVMEIGGGDLQRGHDTLDKWVVKTRNEHINHLKRLPRPEK